MGCVGVLAAYVHLCAGLSAAYVRLTLALIPVEFSFVHNFAAWTLILLRLISALSVTVLFKFLCNLILVWAGTLQFCTGFVAFVQRWAGSV